METHKKITVTGVLSEGIGLGIKNAVSMLGATVLWLLTIWIPYLNVGTTIAMNTIPIELSKGKVISPLFIFDGKYRKYMGEYFTLIGLMYLAIIPALFMGLYPGLSALNIMGLHSPQSAVLSAIIYNALIIIALIPLALKGVKYREVPAGKLLSRNLLIYGLGGLAAPFIFVKLIDMLLVLFGLA